MPDGAGNRGSLNVTITQVGSAGGGPATGSASSSSSNAAQSGRATAGELFHLEPAATAEARPTPSPLSDTTTLQSDVNVDAFTGLDY